MAGTGTVVKRSETTGTLDHDALRSIVRRVLVEHRYESLDTIESAIVRAVIDIVAIGPPRATRAAR